MAETEKALPGQPPSRSVLQVPTEKVLRIGIVQAGKVVHERLVAPGQSVSIGESPKSTFVVPAKSIPKKFVLFVAKGDKYFLNYTDAMKGKISFQDSIKGLDELSKEGTATKKGTVWVLPVGGNTRGKIVFDDVTVLFQFVPPPPVSLKNLGRTDFRPALLDGDDLVFFGFLALFAAVAMVFVAYVYSVEPVELVSLEDIPERFVDIVLPPPEQPKAQEIPDRDHGQARGREASGREAGVGAQARAHAGREGCGRGGATGEAQGRRPQAVEAPRGHPRHARRLERRHRRRRVRRERHGRLEPRRGAQERVRCGHGERRQARREAGRGWRTRGREHRRPGSRRRGKRGRRVRPEDVRSREVVGRRHRRGVRRGCGRREGDHPQVRRPGPVLLRDAAQDGREPRRPARGRDGHHERPRLECVRQRERHARARRSKTACSGRFAPGASPRE